MRVKPDLTLDVKTRMTNNHGYWDWYGEVICKPGTYFCFSGPSSSSNTPKTHQSYRYDTSTSPPGQVDTELVYFTWQIAFMDETLSTLIFTVNNNKEVQLFDYTNSTGSSV